MSLSVDQLNAINGTSSSSSSASSSDTAAADRFLKLLVTQMQNQDPLNPMDNAQITSQMAQISTVSGIETLNNTVTALNTQFLQMQALQGASVVGHNVTIEGNGLTISDGVGLGGFDLTGGPADNVQVEILDTSGKVVDTLQLGAAKTGDHSFTWDAKAKDVADGANYTFRVTAKSGAKVVESKPLMLDYVAAVSMDGSTLNLELARTGTLPYSKVRAFN